MSNIVLWYRNLEEEMEVAYKNSYLYNRLRAFHNLIKRSVKGSFLWKITEKRDSDLLDIADSKIVGRTVSIIKTNKITAADYFNNSEIARFIKFITGSKGH